MRLVGSPFALRFLASSALPDMPLSARSRLESLALIERLVGRGLSVVSACGAVGVGRATYYRWRSRLAVGGVMALADGRAGGRRRRLAPVRSRIRSVVVELRSSYPVGKEKLRVLLARRGLVVSASSVQRVLSELFERGVVRRIGYPSGSVRRRQAARRAHALRKRSGVKPSGPGELVQVDTLHEYSLLGKPRFQFTAVDPTLRWLHAQAFRRASSANAERFLESLIAALPFELKSVQVDNGSEFMGAFERACSRMGIGLYTIPPGMPKANAMVERAQRTCREEFYAFEAPTLTSEEQERALSGWVHYFNHIRPHQALAYKTPAEYARERNHPDLSQLA